MCSVVHNRNPGLSSLNKQDFLFITEGIQWSGGRKWPVYNEVSANIPVFSVVFSYMLFYDDKRAATSLSIISIFKEGRGGKEGIAFYLPLYEKRESFFRN